MQIFKLLQTPVLVPEYDACEVVFLLISLGDLSLFLLILFIYIYILVLHLLQEINK